MSDTSSYNYIIRCGEWDTRSENEPSSHQDRRAKQILLHPGYSGIETVHNDIAIIILENDFTLDRHIDTICLPSRVHRSEISFEDCFATGTYLDSNQTASIQNLQRPFIFLFHVVIIFSICIQRTRKSAIFISICCKNF